ncbi:MAG TPA: enoyl-CoA hydratase [Alphaproteobacteria bacterium]|nr:enoyl-CoA hydratase [Alphaproteobacteria bacterium]
MKSPTERMIVETEGPVGWMIFNNPERRNAVSLDMWQAIVPIVEAYEADPSVRVIVLKGAGDKAFISGADISQFEQQRNSPEAVARYEEIAVGATTRLAQSRKPTIAMIQGYCVGGGVGVALSCDLRIAADNARFAIPAARLGLGYRWIGVKKLVDVVGPSFAKEIFFTARQFDAREALEMGLINRVVAAAELAASVRATCDTIADNAPLTLEAIKGVVEELTRPLGPVDVERCEALVARCFASADYAEGRRAFMEKRKPVFQGK